MHVKLDKLCDKITSWLSTANSYFCGQQSPGEILLPWKVGLSYKRNTFPKLQLHSLNLLLHFIKNIATSMNIITNNYPLHSTQI